MFNQESVYNCSKNWLFKSLDIFRISMQTRMRGMLAVKPQSHILFMHFFVFNESA